MPEDEPPVVPEPVIPIPAAPEAKTDAPLGEGGKKALDAERKLREAADKRATDAENRIKEFEDRDKSDAQKLQEERDAAVAERDFLRTENLRRDVADEKGLTPAHARRLVGTTREELEADADAVLKDFPVTPQKPVFEDVGQGTRVDGNAVRYRQSQLNDHQFWLEHKADIQLAMVEGRIDPD